MPTLAPDVIIHGRYQLQRPVGRGGFSVVWLALDLQNQGRPVALKVSIPEKDPENEQPARMEKQFRMTRSLSHPHLLLPTDFFMMDNAGCLVFEYMAGGTLHHRIIQQGVLKEQEIAELMRQIGGGIQHLHEHSLVHFDIKPENILIDAQGNYKLSDFDTASRLENSMVRVSRIYADTPQYRSPEHLRGASELSEKVDIFAFGTTLFESCEGLMEKEYGIGLMLLYGSDKPKMESDKYAKRLENIIHACWNHLPSDRPSADALVSYAQHLLSKKYWPVILEYNPNDKGQPDLPATKSSETARVTVGHVPPPAQPAAQWQPPVTPHNPPPPVAPPPTPASGQTPNWQPPTTPPPAQSPYRGTLFNKSIRETLGGTVLGKPWVQITLALLFIAAIIIVAFLAIQNNQYHNIIQEATRLKQQGQLKAAYQVVTANKKLDKDPDVKALRLAILGEVVQTHKTNLVLARNAIRSNSPTQCKNAYARLEAEQENASILVLDDSTAHYLNLLKVKIGVPDPEPDESWFTDDTPPKNPEKAGNNTSQNASPIAGKPTPPEEQPSEDPFSIPFRPSKEGSIGLTTAQNRCGTEAENRSFIDGGTILITPKRKIQLKSARIYTNDVGRLSLTVSGNSGGRSARFRLNDQMTNLNFTDTDELSDMVLRPGVTYQIKLELLATSGQKPKAEKSTCPQASTVNGELEIKYQGNYILYDLKYKAE